MLRQARLWLALVGALMATAVMAGPSSAASSYKPDGWVRYYDYYGETWPGDGHNPYLDKGPWKGKDVYNTSAAKQTAKTDVYPPLEDSWAYDRFDMTVQNDGASSRFKIHGASKFSGFKTFYYYGSTNITNAVEAGSYTTPLLAKGTTFVVSVRIDVGSKTFPGESGWKSNSLSNILISSTSDSSRQDAVAIKLTTGSCGC